MRAPQCRKPITASSKILDDDGFFDTGDVATVDEHGYMRITDRSKDVIKSGDKWISSIELENLAVAHPAVAEAAVIGVPLRARKFWKFMDGKIAKWWMPDDITFVASIPHTATGKILKTTLRDRFKGYSFPNPAG